jgi:MoaA/NifB/PqqE/SkfB family radical SAM enzyme
MKKIFFVSTENGCNNSCIGCADNNSGKSKNGRATKDILSDLEQGAKNGYKNLHITGGEFTIQNNVFDILGKARKLYDEIYITSNGRMFSYFPFAKKMVASGITQFNITLCGLDKNHDKWTQVKGSYNETIKGIKNLLSLKANVCVNYLLWKGAFNDFDKAMLMLQQIGVNHVDIFNLVPLGKAKKSYNQLIVELNELINVEKILEKFNFDDVEIEDFPLCIFSESFRNMKNVHIFDTSGKVFLDDKGGIANFSVFAAREFGLCLNSNLTVEKDINKAKEKFNDYRLKIKACDGCKLLNKCNGVFADYTKIRNAEFEVMKLRKMHGY